MFEYDFVTRQGVSNFVEKVRVVATEAQSRIEIEYDRHARLWWESLYALVGDVTWDFVDTFTQLARAEARGEYTYFSLLQTWLLPSDFTVDTPKLRYTLLAPLGGKGGGGGRG